MLRTAPAERRDPPKDAEVSVHETAANTPSAVGAWWYPGERIGYEFIYPRAQARELARTTGASVLTTKADTTKAEETRSGELTRIDSNGHDQDAAAARETGAVAQAVPQRTPPQAAPAAPSPVPPPAAQNSFPNPP